MEKLTPEDYELIKTAVAAAAVVFEEREKRYQEGYDGDTAEKYKTLLKKLV